MTQSSLTSQQRREYDELGYTLVPGVFPTAELVLWDAEIERLQTDVCG